MGVDPRFHGGPKPNASDSEVRFRFREVVISLYELVHSLAGDPKHRGDLGNTDEIGRHVDSV